MGALMGYGSRYPTLPGLLRVPGVLNATRSEYLRQKRYERAIEDFFVVLAEDGDDAGTLYKRAYAYCTNGQRKLGTKDLRAILGIDPKNNEARALLRECT